MESSSNRLRRSVADLLREIARLIDPTRATLMVEVDLNEYVASARASLRRQVAEMAQRN